MQRERYEQAEIVRRVDELFARADALETRVTEARALAEKLEPAILAKAFRGELSEQIPEEAAAWEARLAEIEAAAQNLAKSGSVKTRGKRVRAGAAAEAAADMAAEKHADYTEGASAPKKRGRPPKAQ